MSTVTISDELFERLSRRAAVLNVTVEQLIAPALDLAAEPPSAPPSKPTVEPSHFDAWIADVEARAARYPSDFLMDDGRESAY
jgi:hypothetical protein